MVFVRKYKGPCSEESVKCPVRSCPITISKFRNLPKHLRTKHKFHDPAIKSIVNQIRNCIAGVEDFCEKNLPHKIRCGGSGQYLDGNDDDVLLVVDDGDNFRRRRESAAASIQNEMTATRVLTNLTTTTATHASTSVFHGGSPLGSPPSSRNAATSGAFVIRVVPTSSSIVAAGSEKLSLAGPSNQGYSGKPENTRRKKIAAAATLSSATVLIPDDSPPQPTAVKIQKKQIDDRRFEERRFEEQRFQERRFENRRFDDRRQMTVPQSTQMAAKSLQAQQQQLQAQQQQMQAQQQLQAQQQQLQAQQQQQQLQAQQQQLQAQQQHMNVVQTPQAVPRPVQVLAPPVQIPVPKPKPVEKPRPREKRIFVVADHQRCVMSNLASLWKSGKLCDAGIGNGSSTVMVHKVVLSAVCPKLLSVFSTDILSHKFLQVNFPEEVSTEALNAFAEYMYNGILDLDRDILEQLKIIAKRLDMKEFEQLCDGHLPNPIPHQPASTASMFGDLTLMQANLTVPPNMTVPTVQLSNHQTSNSVSLSSQSAPSITTQVIDVKQEISEAELAQVKKDTAAVFGQESEVASLDVNKTGNSTGGFVIVPSVKTEPVGPEDDRYGNLAIGSSHPFTSTTSSYTIANSNSAVVSTTEYVLPFVDTIDSSNMTAATSVQGRSAKLKSNLYDAPLVSDLSPVSCIVETMCSQSSPIRDDPSKPLILPSLSATQSAGSAVTSSGGNAGVYPVGLFTAGGDNLPLLSTPVTNVKTIDLYKTNNLT